MRILNEIPIIKGKCIYNCIYVIQSIVNKKIYVGSAVNFTDRRGKHLRDLCNNRHHNQRLQNHYNKYGKEDLIFKVVRISDREKLIEDEQYFIDLLLPFFNISKKAGSTMGVPMKSHVKKALLDSQYKIIRDYSYRKKISNSTKGKFVSNETKLKISLANKGKKLSNETKLKISNSKIGKFIEGESPRSKKIICVNNGKIYDSSTQASKDLSIPNNHIGSVCNGNRKSTHGFIFKHVRG